MEVICSKNRCVLERNGPLLTQGPRLVEKINIRRSPRNKAVSEKVVVCNDKMRCFKVTKNEVAKYLKKQNYLLNKDAQKILDGLRKKLKRSPSIEQISLAIRQFKKSLERKKSPAKKSKSPAKAKSPAKKSKAKSPAKKSKVKAKSPAKKAKSPAKKLKVKAKSPTKKSKSPAKAKSPAKKAKSPAKKSKSPAKVKSAAQKKKEVNKRILWKDKLAGWKKGEVLTYPKNINKRFFYQTSINHKNKDDVYVEKFIISKELQKLKMDPSSFNEHIKKCKDKNVCTFFNPSGDTKLIIPMPRDKKNFTTIKDFIDNASLDQQKKFWMKAAKEIEAFKNKHGQVYVCTHGLQVPYLHLRVSEKPKEHK